ncbi:hypothetical protein J4Q44_G00225610 [Coregonus suidteri]|uniref:Thyroglobulin type-1 domain-containing protein n=1 Tax=Coregonus suidteri TaxID=861788 RepID=A0AAN8QQX6_9TELE
MLASIRASNLHLSAAKAFTGSSFVQIQKVEFFEPFWYGGEPRVGERRARGWRAWLQPSEQADEDGEDQEESEVKNKTWPKWRIWLDVETSREIIHWLPWRPDKTKGQSVEDCEDPDQQVLRYVRGRNKKRVKAQGKRSKCLAKRRLKPVGESGRGSQGRSGCYCDTFSTLPENGLSNRIRSLFEIAIATEHGVHCPLLWRMYMNFLVTEGKVEKRRGIFYKALQDVPWAKGLYMYAVQLFPEHVQEFLDLMTEKELRQSSHGGDKECNDDAFPFREDCEVDTVCGEAVCHHNQYVTCHVNRCGTCEPVFRGYDNITVNCTQLTPKCRLIHLEMLSKHRMGTMLPGGSSETKYHPDCDGAGMFRPKQCREEDANLCWCVNKAGVPVSDKTHDPLKCEWLVTVHVIDIQFAFKVAFTPVAKTMDEIRRQLVLKLDREYTLDKTQILDITVRELYQVVSIRLTDNRTDKEPVDIATVAYYIERDLKSNTFGFEVDGWRLEVVRDSVKVLFFHYDHPHMDMMTINPGVAALIIALAIIIGVSVSAVVRRKALLERRRFQFEVIEVQGQDNHMEQQEATMTYFVM